MFWLLTASFFDFNNISFIQRHVWIQRGDRGSGPLLKNHKNIGFSSNNTGPDPLKNGSYQASIQCWVIISTPAKRHLMAFRNACRQMVACLYWYLNPPSPHQLKTMKKVNKQCLLDTPPPQEETEKTWQVIVQTSRAEF